MIRVLLKIYLMVSLIACVIFDNSSSTLHFQVIMTDADTKEELRFPVDRWLSRDDDDGEVVREFPVCRPNMQPLPGMTILRSYLSL